MEKKVLGVLLTTTPYTFQNSHTFYEMCVAALEKGYGVKVFLFVDGVNNVKLNQDPDPDRPMNDKFAELVEKGVEFQLCGLCTSARGFDQKGSDYIPGVEVSGLTEFAEIVGECDKFVAFTL
ncbi:MAG: DsrE/DsrF/TusD sulfur relay family protein [Candidatus Thorarchaeota archaeon]|nr:MAG: sulfur oxidoreductase [Candidatus Thorarchaeota archaeon]